MYRFVRTMLVGGALALPLAVIPASLQAQEERYHDRGHNDDHVWNDHEDKAYRIWVKENHRKYREFRRLPDQDREAYWAWRHEHSDAILKIDVR